MRAWLSGVLVERGRADEAVAWRASSATPAPRHVEPHPGAAGRGTVAVRSRRSAGPSHSWPNWTCSPAECQPQRRLPVALLPAEAAWTDGRTADIVSLTQDVWTASAPELGAVDCGGTGLVAPARAALSMMSRSSCPSHSR